MSSVYYILEENVTVQLVAKGLYCFHLFHSYNTSILF